MRKITLAQVGCGYWGPNLLRVFQELPGARLKWLCDKKSGRLAWAQEKYPALQTTTSLFDVLNDPEVEAVVVATEVVTHHAIATEALKAKKHVFVEKPLAHSSEQARDLAKNATARRLILAVGHVFLYHPAFSVLRERLKSGRLGRLRYVDMARVNPGPPEPRHDVIWDMAPHDVAMALDLAGTRPLSVRATGRRWRGALDEAAFVEVSFPDKVVARIHVSWLSSRRLRRVEAYCEKASAFYDDTEPVKKLQIVWPGEDTRVGAKAWEKKALYYGPGKNEEPRFTKSEALKIECADFLDAIRRGRKPYSDATLGVAVVRVLEAAARSAARGGQEVRLS